MCQMYCGNSAKLVVLFFFLLCLIFAKHNMSEFGFRAGFKERPDSKLSPVLVEISSEWFMDGAVTWLRANSEFLACGVEKKKTTTPNYLSFFFKKAEKTKTRVSFGSVLFIRQHFFYFNGCLYRICTNALHS